MSDGFVKNPDELGALWVRTGPKGDYMTGEINGVKVVVFPAKKKSDKSPDWRVLKSKPREDRAPVSAPADDSIPF